MREILFCLCMVIFFLPLGIAQEDEATANIKKILESNKCNWTFVDMPFQKTIDFISDTNKINIVVDPNVARNLASNGAKVNLHLTDIRLKDALNLLLDMNKVSSGSLDKSLCYMFCNNVLFITTTDSELSKSPVKAVFHDTSIISPKNRTVPIYARKLQDGIWLPYSSTEELKIRGYQKNSLYSNSYVILEMIKYFVAKDTWCTGNYSIAGVGNHALMVFHTPDVQEQISLFLKELSSFPTPSIPIELWGFEVDNSILISSKLYCSPVVDEKTLSILEDAARTRNSRVIFHTKVSASNHILVPLVVRGKSERKCLIRICPTLYPNKEVLIEMASIISEPCEYQDTSVEKTAFQNFGSVFLMPSGKISTIALSPLCDGRSLIMLMRVSPEQWEPLIKPLEAKVSPEEEKIRQILREKMVTLNFKGTPLSEVISFLSTATGINMIIDPEVYKKPQEKEASKPQEKEESEISITCSDVSCESILNLILDFKNLTYRIYCGVIVISTKIPRNTPILRMYDIQDIRINPNYDFFSTGKIDSSPFECRYSPYFPYPTGDEEFLIGLLKNNIGGVSWEEEGVSIDIFRGILMMRQIPAVHKDVFRFIDYLRTQHRKNRRMISIWEYLAPKDKSPETMALVAASNLQKIYVKSGVLYMGNTQKDKERRKEEVDYLDTNINLQDQMDKREALSLYVTPLLREEWIELALELKCWGNHGFERNLTVPVPNGKTVAVATIPGDKEELTLFVGAFTQEE